MATSIQIGGSFNAAANIPFTGTDSFSQPLGAQLFTVPAKAPGTYSLANSGWVITDGNGTEILRIWATDPDTNDDYNSGNLYIGALAGWSQPHDNTSAGYGNTGLGTDALYQNTTGFYNTALGEDALYNLTTGDHNMGTGYNALYNIVAGTHNTQIGAGDGPLGDYNYTIAVGANAAPSGTGHAVIGDTNVTDVYLGSEIPAGTLHAKNLIAVSMPTSDPHVVGELYSVAGVVHVSAG